jgi:hypothetical protein
MGFRRSFWKRPAAAATGDAVAIAGGPEPAEPLTPERLIDLQEAWAELVAAAEASGVSNLDACTRTGRSWTENPATVRAIAAALRDLPAPDTQTPR